MGQLIKVDTTGRTWTYGVEHELADWDTRKGWDGYGRDPEPNIMNTNGIAGDPTLKDNPWGAEINTPPTDRPEDQADLLAKFLKRHPTCTTSHRVGMHVHIRVPGLRDSVPHLVRLQRFLSAKVGVIKLIDPLDYPDGADKATRKWVQYLRRSHWTTIPANRIDRQVREARTLEDFLKLEVPADRNGNPLYHAQPRASMNLRQLAQTDTVEFRPFMQPLKPSQVVTAAEWCRDFLRCAFDGGDPMKLYRDVYARKTFPPLPQYVHWKQLRWEATSYSLNKRDAVRANVARILNGDFDDRPVGPRTPYAR